MSVALAFDLGLALVPVVVLAFGLRLALVVWHSPGTIAVVVVQVAALEHQQACLVEWLGHEVLGAGFEHWLLGYFGSLAYH